MNRIHCLVWNRTLRVLQVASELIRTSHAAPGISGGTPRHLPLARLAVALMLCLGGTAVAHAGDVCNLAASGTTTPVDTGGSTATGGSINGHAPVVACGESNHASGDSSTAFGSDNTAAGSLSSTFGYANQATTLAEFGSAFGYSNTADAYQANAFGYGNAAHGMFSSAFGSLSVVGDGANYSIAFGAGNAGVASDDGARVAANVANAIAIGHTVNVNANDGVAMGHQTYVLSAAQGSVALGSGSVADTANVVSVGHSKNDPKDPAVAGLPGGNYGSELDRRVTHVAAGIHSTDAVNVQQLNQRLASVSNPWFVANGDPAANGSDYPTVTGNDTLAAGATSAASGAYSSAVGWANTATGGGSNAFGSSNTADAAGSDAFGTANQALDGSNAFGIANQASTDSSAFGAGNKASNFNVAFGNANRAVGKTSNAIGNHNESDGDYSSALGTYATTDSTSTYSIALGAGDSSAHGATVTGATSAIAIGRQVRVKANEGMAIGHNALVDSGATSGVAIGVDAIVAINASDGVAIGHNAIVENSNATGAVALGTDSVAQVADTLSVGHTTGDVDPVTGKSYAKDLTRRITNVAAGTDPTDAVNKSQLDAVSGVANTGWNLTAQGANSSNVGPNDTVDLSNTDGNLKIAKTTISDNVTFNLADDLNVISVKTGGTTIDTNGVTITGGPDITKTGVDAGGKKITNVVDGTVASGSNDAVNGGQLFTTNQGVATNATTIVANGKAITANTKAIGTNATAIGTLNSMAVFYTNAAHVQVMLGTAGTPVTLSNVAPGQAPTDAVNKAQLDAVATQVGQTAANAVTYDGSSKTHVTLAGQGGTTVSGVKAGKLSGNSTDAVNGSQLHATNQQVAHNTTTLSSNTQAIADNANAIHTNATKITGLDNRVTTVEGQVTQLQQTTASLAYVAVDGKGDGSDDASVVMGSRGVAIGSSAKAGGDHGTAVGGDSHAAGANDTALGGNATVNADGSTAVGANTRVAQAATNAVAVGESATVEAASGTAVGQGAKVAAADAVALGQGSVANQARTVSVGSQGHERRVTNVAAAKAGTDAVNRNQLDAVTEQAVAEAKHYAQTGDATTLRQANAYTDQQIQVALGGDVAKFRQNVNDRFYQINRRMDRMNAMRSAATQMAINAAGAQGNGRLAVGIGFSSGRSALSVGYGAPLGKRLHVSFGATASGSEASAGIGFGVDL